MSQKQKRRNFDLIALEKSLNDCYEKWKEEGNEKTRSDMFSSIEKLAYAILNVHKTPRIKSDLKNTAYEYAVYLFERIVLGVFVPVFRDKMPWQSYIDLNLRHIIFHRDKDSWLDLMSDLEYITSNDSSIYDTQDNDVSHYLPDLSKQLYKMLRMFYSDSRIKELLPLSMDIVFSSKYKNSGSTESLPTDVKDFVNVVVTMSKRLTREYNINEQYSIPSSSIDKTIRSAVRSTLFMSSVVNSSFFNKELLLALDIDSLHRLVSVLGGEKIKIPNQREFNTLIGSVAIASKAVFDDVPIKKATGKIKRDMDLVFSHQINIQNYVSKIIECAGINEENKSKPFVCSMLESMKLYEKVFENYVGGMCNNYSEESVASVKFLSDSLGNYIDSIERIKGHVEYMKSIKSFTDGLAI